MVTIVTAKVKAKWKARKLNKEKLETYWHALFPMEEDYVKKLTSQVALKVGDIVRYKVPESPAEAQLRFELTEVNGDRGYMTCLNSGMHIHPVDLVRMDDIELAQ